MSKSGTRNEIIKTKKTPESIRYNRDKDQLEKNGEALIDQTDFIIEHGKSGGLLDD